MPTLYFLFYYIVIFVGDGSFGFAQDKFMCPEEKRFNIVIFVGDGFIRPEENVTFLCNNNLIDFISKFY